MYKKYVFVEDLDREWAALTACRHRYIQDVVAKDSKGKIELTYYSDGVPLSKLNKDQRVLFFLLLPKIILAITHCHKKGWVHGDIKPENILYQPKSNSIKLIDFSASYPKGTKRSKLQRWQFTRAYAHKQIMSGVGTVRPFDDWYALGQMIRHVIAI